MPSPKERAEHKAQRAAAKLRRSGAPALEPEMDARDTARRFLIISEGTVTEPSYFESFRLPTANVEAIGKGKDTLTLVRAAIKIANRSKKTYDEKWVVFDKDGFKEDDFDNAIKKAEANGFRVAYSNQAFEYWFLLHFDAHGGGGLHRDQCIVKLNNHLNPLSLHYDPDAKRLTSAIFEQLILPTGKIRKGKGGKSIIETKELLAGDRAKKILSFHKGTAPSQAESSTTVHLLVHELNKYR
jgi:hypothetical protein